MTRTDRSLTCSGMQQRAAGREGNQSLTPKLVTCSSLFSFFLGLPLNCFGPQIHECDRTQIPVPTRLCVGRRVLATLKRTQMASAARITKGLQRRSQASCNNQLQSAVKLKSVRRTKGHARAAADDIAVWMPVANVSRCRKRPFCLVVLHYMSI